MEETEREEMQTEEAETEPNEAERTEAETQQPETREETQQDEAQEMTLEDLLEDPNAKEDTEQENGRNPPETRQDASPTAATGKGTESLSTDLKMLLKIAGPDAAQAFARDENVQAAVNAGANVLDLYAQYRERQAKATRKSPPVQRQSSSRAARRSVTSLSDKQFADVFDRALYETERGAKISFD